MISQSINLAEFESVPEAVEAAKQFVLAHGFTVIQYSDRYFDYMKDNKFGHFTTGHWPGFRLSSVWKPSKQNGTGASTGDDFVFEFTALGFQNVLDHPRMGFVTGNVVFYQDLDDFLKSKSWVKEEIRIYHPEIKVPDRSVS